MTDTTLAVIGWGLAVGGYAAQVADYVMTVKGLDRGMTEVGVINSLVIKKWGKGALPLATFLEATAFTVGLAAFATCGMAYLVAYAGGFLAAEVANDIHSAKLLKII